MRFTKCHPYFQERLDKNWNKQSDSLRDCSINLVEIKKYNVTFNN